MAGLGNIYNHSPHCVQNTMLAGRGLVRALALELAGAWAGRQRLRQTGVMSAAELVEWQAQRLTTTLRHAAATVPHYAQQLPPAQNAAYHARHVLAGWPELSRQDVVRAGSRLYSDARGPALVAFTSGSTGSPLKLLRSAQSIAAEDALVERQMMWAGWRRGMRRVWLRGDVVVPLRAAQAPFWRHNRSQAMLMCSSFHLTEQTAPQYLAAIEHFDPVLIQAYPSVIAYLARWMREHRRRYRGVSLRGVMTSSERLLDVWRRDCSWAFGVRVFDWFGQAERVAAIGTCELGNYHVIEDGSLVELHARGDGSAAVFGTTFHNEAMPLIRYDTGDCVVPADPAYVCPCLRPFRVIDRIYGRESDAIVTADGRHHVMADFIFDNLTALKEAQIVQESMDLVVINVVLQPGSDFAALRKILLDRTFERLGPTLTVEVRVVHAVPRTAAGKFPLIVNKLARGGALS